MVKTRVGALLDAIRPQKAASIPAGNTTLDSAEGPITRVVQIFAETSTKHEKLTGENAKAYKLELLAKHASVSNIVSAVDALRETLGLDNQQSTVYASSVDEAADRFAEMPDATRILPYMPLSSFQRDHAKRQERELLERHPDLLEKTLQLYGHFIFDELNLHTLQEKPGQITPFMGRGYSIFAKNKALQLLALGLVSKDHLPEYLGVGALEEDIPGMEGIHHIQSPAGATRVVAKPVTSAMGKGVMIDHPDNLKVVSMPHLIPLDRYYPGSITAYLLESFVPGTAATERATDLRVVLHRDWNNPEQAYFVKGMIRVGKEGSSTSNLASGGLGIGLSGRAAIDDPTQRTICESYGIDPDNPHIPDEVLAPSLLYAEAMGLPVIGFDWGAGPDGPKLFEANLNPGPQINRYNGFINNERLRKVIKENGLDTLIEPNKYVSDNADIVAANLVRVVERSLAYRLPHEDIMEALDVQTEDLGRKVTLSGETVTYLE